MPLPKRKVANEFGVYELTDFDVSQIESYNNTIARMNEMHLDTKVEADFETYLNVIKSEHEMLTSEDFDAYKYFMENEAKTPEERDLKNKITEQVNFNEELNKRIEEEKKELEKCNKDYLVKKEYVEKNLNNNPDFINAKKLYEAKTKELDEYRNIDSTIDTLNAEIYHLNKNIVEAGTFNSQLNYEQQTERRMNALANPENQALKRQAEIFEGSFNEEELKLIDKMVKLETLNKAKENGEKTLPGLMNEVKDLQNKYESFLASGEDAELLNDANFARETAENTLKGYERMLSERNARLEEMKNQAISHGKENAQSRSLEVNLIISEANQYKYIEDDMTQPTKLSAYKAKSALNVVKGAYDKYNAHSFFGKMFSFLPWTQASKDYKEYKESVEMFNQITNIPTRDIENYAKTGNAQNQLESALNGTLPGFEPKSIVDKIEKIEIDEKEIEPTVENNSKEVEKNTNLDKSNEIDDSLEFSAIEENNNEIEL